MKIIENNIEKWLNEISNNWLVPIVQIPNLLGKDEIENRYLFYPEIKTALKKSEIDFELFINACKSSWALGDRFTQIRFTRFISNKLKAIGAINALINNFPHEEDAIIKRINEFIAEAVKLGFLNKNGRPERPGAALLASVILTSVYNSRFVDYRHNRWNNFTEKFFSGQIHQNKDYGRQIVEASQYAKMFLESNTYSKYWSSKGNLWDIAGICWVGLYTEVPETGQRFEEEFPEGRRKETIHRSFERNTRLIKKKKEEALKLYGRLSCEVCGFDFNKFYGDFGKNYIEAHHNTPVSELKPNHKSKISDISLLCSNCHTMVHHGKITISVEELKEYLTTKTKITS